MCTCTYFIAHMYIYAQTYQSTRPNGLINKVDSSIMSIFYTQVHVFLIMIKKIEIIGTEQNRNFIQIWFVHGTSSYIQRMIHVKFMYNSMYSIK